MSVTECKSAKLHRSIGIALFIIGVIILVFIALTLVLSAYLVDPIIDGIALWLYATGALIVLLALAIAMVLIGALIHMGSTKTLAECNIK